MPALLILFLLVPWQARATYIDVGSGSYLLQLIIAWAAFLLVAPKVPLKRLMQWVKRTLKNKRHD